MIVSLRRFALRRGSSSRWYAAAAAGTARQKRALNADQLQGQPTAPPSSLASSPSSLSSSSSSPTSSSLSSAAASNPNLVPIGLGALAVAGGAYYFLGSSSVEQTKPAPTTVAPKSSDVVKPEPSSSKTKETKPKEFEGNRVVSIQVPEKMKGSSTSPLPILQHPVGGNRVTTLIPQSTTTKDSAEVQVVDGAGRAVAVPTDASMTERALAELRSTAEKEAEESVLQSHHSLWGSILGTDTSTDSDSTLSSLLPPSLMAASPDLDQFTESQLKARLVQLVTELKERTKWEAVRLKEFLAMKEKETADKYLEILQKQRMEFEDILAKRLREQEHELANQMRNALMEKEAAIQTLLNAALEAQKEEHEQDKKAFEEVTSAEIRSQIDQDYSKQLEDYKSRMAHELQQKVAALESLAEKLKHLESALSASKASQQGSLKAHKLSAAALALSQKLETSEPAATEFQALEAAAGPGGVITVALATIPTSVRNAGVPTVSELQARFDSVYKQCRKAALVPEGRPGLEGQLAGIAFSALKYPPQPDDPAPEDNPDHPEYVLVRAKKHVQLGEIEMAVEQLEKLKGQTAFTAEDWKKDAMNRVAVEKALKVIKLECALVNESLVE